MNIYEKLQTARVRLLEAGLKKSGQNNFVKFHYFELSDFLPDLQKIIASLRLATHFEIKQDVAVLKIIDFEKEKENFIEFSCPLVFAENKQSQPIQNLGATITYLRRYLYLIAFEIVESDEVDNQPLNSQKENNDNDDIEILKSRFFYLLQRKEIKSAERLERLLKIKEDIEKNDVNIVRLNNAIMYLNTLQDVERFSFLKEDDNDKSK